MSTEMDVNLLSFIESEFYTVFAINVISTVAFEGKEATPIAARVPMQLFPRFSISKSDA